MSKKLSQSKGIRRWALILYWIMMYIATHLPRVPKFAPELPRIDIFVHFIIYAGWATLWWWFLSTGKKHISRPAIRSLIIGGAAYALFDELTQGIVGRNPSIGDFICDLLGILATVTILERWQNKKR